MHFIIQTMINQILIKPSTYLKGQFYSKWGKLGL